MKTNYRGMVRGLLDQLRRFYGTYRDLVPFLSFALLYPLVDRGFLYFFHRMFPLYTGWESLTTPSLLWSTTTNWGWALAVLLVLLPILISYDQLGWPRFELRFIRPAITVLALVFAWNLSFSEYNFFYDQGYVADRLFVLLMAGLVYRHPGFVAPLLVAGLGFQSQFELTFTEPLLPTHFLFTRFLFAFLVFLYVRTIFEVPDRFLGFAWLFVPFGFLWDQGIERLFAGEQLLDWIRFYEPAYALGWARLQGWWGCLPETTYDSLRTILDSSGFLFPHLAQWTALAAPLGLLNGPTALIILTGFGIVLLGVFLGVGILLWKELLAIVVVGTFITVNRTRIDDFLNGRRTLLGIMMILVLPLVPVVPEFGFTGWPTRYVTRTDLQGVDSSGGKFRLPPRTFGPYRNQMGISTHQFRTLIPFVQLPSSSANLDQVRRINSMLDNNEMLLALDRAKMEYGEKNNNRWHNQHFHKFLKRYLENLRNRSKTQGFLRETFRSLGPPSTVFVPYENEPIPLPDRETLANLRTINLVFYEGVVRGNEVHVLNSSPHSRFPLESRRGITIHERDGESSPRSRDPSRPTR